MERGVGISGRIRMINCARQIAAAVMKDKYKSDNVIMMNAADIKPMPKGDML